MDVPTGISESENAHFGWKKTVLYSLLPLILLLVLLESAGRLIEVVAPPLPTDFGWGFDVESRVFVPSEAEPHVYITDPSKEISFPELFFEMPKPPNEYRIFMLGGSSVYNLANHFGTTAARLTSATRGKHEFKFLTAGGNAYGTHRLASVAAEIMDYEPDLVLVYSGHNEFEELEQLQLVRLDTLALQRVLYWSAFCRVIRDRVASIQIFQARREHNRAILDHSYADWRSGAAHVYSPEEVRERIEAYQNNLSIIITLCWNNGVPIILGTVPSNLWQPDLPEDYMVEHMRSLYDNGAFKQGLDYVRPILRTIGRHQASDAENDVIRALARTFSLPLADVEAAVIKAEPNGVPGETLFRDRCHLNTAGNAILMSTFEKAISALLGLEMAAANHQDFRGA